MTQYTPPPVGSRVKITVEGVVEQASEYFLCVVDGPALEWSSNEVDTPPSVQVLVPDFRMGDVGSYTNSRGVPRTVFYMALPGKSSGWYDSTGMPIHFDTGQYPDMVVRYDGVLMKEVTR